MRILFLPIRVLPIVAAFLFQQTVNGSAIEPAKDLRSLSAAFFSRNCMDCHDGEAKKGGLDLALANPVIAGVEQTDLWTRIYDRVARGEMPPAKKPRPAPAEVDGLLAAVRPRLIEADRHRREVVQRRLNRVEYQNTIHDLLGVEVDLRPLLPADQQAGGFDNNGEALAVSTEQMQSYLEAAHRAIDAATLVGERPESQKFTVDPSVEMRKAIEAGEFGLKDGRVVLSVTDKGDYSKVATRDHRTPAAGFTMFASRRRQLIRPSVSFSRRRRGALPVKAPQRTSAISMSVRELKTFEVDALLDEKCFLQFFVFGLPTWIKPEPNPKHPGIAFGEVEFTGPIVEQWPPRSYTRLIG